ncbi:hypothetical protein CNEONATNEC26_01418 [Clostridium neonatale]|uniref:hypothetical protein n=1 Tax=Clostridium neonatale TaxID=137838 RepID=UPI0012E53BFB|nr:hypothetical protein [Clostridium neonatale]SUQ47220.1 hypothetical protein CNEONATNEC26_01418 [Clostridium neonatale]
MINENNQMEIRKDITREDEQMLRKALEGINGWYFNPIAVITNGYDEYYFICKVKTIIENLQMKIAKISIKINERIPRLLGIEEIPESIG